MPETGWSQKNLRRRNSAKPVSIANIRRGQQRIFVHTAIQICAVLDVSNKFLPKAEIERAQKGSDFGEAK